MINNEKHLFHKVILYMFLIISCILCSSLQSRNAGQDISEIDIFYDFLEDIHYSYIQEMDINGFRHEFYNKKDSNMNLNDFNDGCRKENRTFFSESTSKHTSFVYNTLSKNPYQPTTFAIKNGGITISNLLNKISGNYHQKSNKSDRYIYSENLNNESNFGSTNIMDKSKQNHVNKNNNEKIETENNFTRTNSWFRKSFRNAKNMLQEKLNMKKAYDKRNDSINIVIHEQKLKDGSNQNFESPLKNHLLFEQSNKNKINVPIEKLLSQEQEINDEFKDSLSGEIMGIAYQIKNKNFKNKEEYDSLLKEITSQDTTLDKLVKKAKEKLPQGLTNNEKVKIELDFSKIRVGCKTIKLLKASPFWNKMQLQYKKDKILSKKITKFVYAEVKQVDPQYFEKFSGRFIICPVYLPFNKSEIFDNKTVLAFEKSNDKTNLFIDPKTKVKFRYVDIKIHKELLYKITSFLEYYGIYGQYFRDLNEYEKEKKNWFESLKFW